jgi:hypothetical protein
MLLSLLAGDDPGCWAALGFEVDGDVVRVGPVSVRCDGQGGGIRGWTLRKSAPVEPREVAGIATTWSGAEPGPPGAFALDHIVLLTGRLDASVADLVAVGGDERRRMTQPQTGASLAFVRMGDTLLEVAERDGPPVLWGLVAVVDDLGTLPPHLVGTPKDAVQPGRRIVTARRQDGLETALAFMTPRVRTR